MYYEHMPAPRPLPLSSRPLTNQQSAALSDPVRLRLFDLVRRAGSTGVCSCDLTEPLKRSQPTISHHLKVLRDAGLVQARREGTWLWYSVVEESLSSVQSFILR